MVKSRKAGILLLLLLAGGIGWFSWWKQSATKRLPYRDGFALGHAEEWHAYGGTWALRDGGVTNRSDERGAKLVAGNFRWKDYALHADVKTLGAGGDVGVLVRVNSPSTGINSYRGYYAGVQARGGGLILGAANSDWVAVRPAAIVGGINAGVWYHLDIVAVGCVIAAHLSNIQSGAETWSALQEPHCAEQGAVGLRSLDTGAEWKNISVNAAEPAELTAILQHVAAVERPTYPSREQDFAAMMKDFYQGYDQMERVILRRRSLELSPTAGAGPPLRTIKALQIQSPNETVTLRGVVTLPDPLFILDETGGISIQTTQSGSFNVGDELEVTGSLHARGDRTFHTETVRVLWDRTPVHPVSVTSTQAASGSYEGSLVELRGDLIAVSTNRGGDYVLEMQDTSQRFRVLVPRGLNSERPREWKGGSLLLVRGVCIASPDTLLHEASFMLRARSDVDVEVVASPPWNRGARLFILIGLACSIVVTGVAVYLKLDRWRNRVVSQERERLALEMHDTLAQSFAGVSFHLQSMRKSIQNNRNVPDALKEKLDAACSMTAETHREASDRIAVLHPATEDGDVLAQLRRSAVMMLHGGHLPIRFASFGRPKHFSFAVRHELLAIAREAIANTLQHSKATEMRITIHYEERRATLSVEDNGEGFNPTKMQSGLGIQGMYSRAKLVNGLVQIKSEPGAGTKTAITVPFGRRLSLLDWLLFLRRRFLNKAA